MHKLSGCGKTWRIQLETVSAICTRIIQMDRLHVTSWYQILDFSKYFSLKSANFFRNRSTRSALAATGEHSERERKRERESVCERESQRERERECV